MQNEKGYTLPELIVVIVVVGIFTFITINKMSYAFQDNNQITKETEELILLKTANTYAENIIDTLKENDVYITGKDLVDEEYLIDDEHKMTNVKLKLSYNETLETPQVEILE